MHSSADGAIYEPFFNRRSLLLGLAHFFFGLVLARVRLALKIGVLSEALDSYKEPQVEAETSNAQDSQRKRKRDLDLWKAFEDEAQREMMRSLSVSKAVDNTDEGCSMSSRSIQ